MDNKTYLDYDEYIQSPEWKQKDSEFVKEVGECEGCGSKKNLRTHHLNYKNLGNETRQDIQVLCKNCHSKIPHSKTILNTPFDKLKEVASKDILFKNLKLELSGEKPKTKVTQNNQVVNNIKPKEIPKEPIVNLRKDLQKLGYRECPNRKKSYFRHSENLVFFVGTSVDYDFNFKDFNPDSFKQNDFSKRATSDIITNEYFTVKKIFQDQKLNLHFKNLRKCVVCKRFYHKLYSTDSVKLLCSKECSKKFKEMMEKEERKKLEYLQSKEKEKKRDQELKKFYQDETYNSRFKKSK